MTRVILLTFSFIIAAAGGYIAYHLLNPETLNPAIATFYKLDEEAYIKDNGYIGIMGVNAPAGVQDTYDWALTLVNNNWQEQLNYKAKQESGVPPDHITQLASLFDVWDSIPDKLSIRHYHPQMINCWLKKGWLLPNKDLVQTCDNSQELANLVQDNALLLTRYRSQFNHNRFVGLPQVGGVLIAKDMIYDQEIFIAYLVTLEHSHPDEALQEWMKNAKFLKGALADQTNTITRSVVMAMYRETLSILPFLLGSNATLAAKYEKQLLEILVPYGPKDMNIAATVKMDYYFLSHDVRQFDTHNQNKLYQYGQDEISLAQTPPSHLAEAETAFMERYSYPKFPDNMTKEDVERLSPNELKQLVAKLPADTQMDWIISSLTGGAELVKSMAGYDAIARILNLYVQIRAKGIASDGVAAFIRSSPAKLYDPFTERPFGYDADAKLIYFLPLDVPGGKYGLILN